jgi:hypothetical protein
MRQLTESHLAELRGSHAAPCVSLYQPTHRAHPDSQQDPIRFRNLSRSMESSLRRKYSARDVAELTRRLRRLERDRQFWAHRTEGLAILSSPTTFELFDLQREVRELLVVADRFYTKPLLRILQSADRYQILCLTRAEARLYEGNRDALDPVDLSDIATTLTEVLGDQLTEPRVAVRSAPGGATVHYGSGQSGDEVDLDRDRFFRAIDRAIQQHHSAPSRLPLMLVALTQYHAPFRAVTHNPLLLAAGLQINPDALTLEDLRNLAWQQLEPVYLARIQTLIDNYRAARIRRLASEDLSEVANATHAGRVGVLLVEADRQVPGRIDETTGLIEPGELADPETGDVLNDLAESVMRMKGQVVVVPADRMPSATGVAATFRF